MACRPYRLRRHPYYHLPAPSLQHVYSVVARDLSLSDRMAVSPRHRRARRGLHHAYVTVIAFLADDDRAFSLTSSDFRPGETPTSLDHVDSLRPAPAGRLGTALAWAQNDASDYRPNLRPRNRRGKAKLHPL
jgi:hypothetical protein